MAFQFDEPAEVAQIKLMRMAALSTTLQNGRTSDVTFASIKTGNINDHLESNTLVRPWAVVRQLEAMNLSPIGVGPVQVHIAQGTLRIYLSRDVPAELLDDSQEIETEMARWFGKVMSDIMLQSEQEDPWLDDFDDDIYAFPNIRDIRRVEFAEIDPKYRPTLGHFYFAAYDVDWGPTE